MGEGLKYYQCIKQVHARPMTLGEFVKMTGKQIPGKPETAGYQVIYNRGTEQHYESWSPKEAFEEGYKEIDSTL